MESTVFSLQITSIENPATPQQFYFDDCFSIIFNCTLELIQITQHQQRSEVNFSSTVTTEAILVPSDILCSCTPLTDLNREDTILLHEIFSSVPITPEFFLLDQILAGIGEIARKILSGEGCDTREIVVNLHIVTTRNSVQNSDIYNDDLYQHVPKLAQLVNLLERSKIKEQDDDAKCAICLEKFGHGNEDSSVEVVRTNCSHVFHDCCMLRWLRRCADCPSLYSCPLCRGLISPTLHSDDE